MARKPRARVDTSRLRAMGETTRVVARPVDTYVRPAPVQENRQYTQILNALSTLNPAIQNFVDVRSEEIANEESNKGEKSFYEASPDERKAIAKQIKDGEIDETQSPFWVEGFARSLLRNHAKDYGDNLMMALEENKDKPNFDFGAFVANERKEYIEANSLSGFRSDIFNDEFGDVTQRFENIAQQRNYEHQISKARKGRLDTMVGEMSTALESLGESIENGSFDAVKSSASINAIIQTAIDQGNDPTRAINAAVEFLRGTARQYAEDGGYYEGILDVLSNVKLKAGTYGVVYKEDFVVLEHALEDAREAYDDQNGKYDVDSLTEEAQTLVEELMVGTRENQFKESWYNAEEQQTKRDRLQIIDGLLGRNYSGHVDDFYQNKGEVEQATDPEAFRSLVDLMATGVDASDEIEAAWTSRSISYAEYKNLKASNLNRLGTFIQEINLPNIPNMVMQTVKQDSDPLQGLLSNETRNRFASEAFTEINQFILDIMPKVKSGDMTVSEARTAIIKEQARIEDFYRKKAKETANGIVPEGTKKASDEEVRAWQSGDSPWKDDAGDFISSPEQLANDFENLIIALENNPNAVKAALADSVLGKMIAPLIAADEPIMEILLRLETELVEELNKDRDPTGGGNGDNLVEPPEENLDEQREDVTEAYRDGVLSAEEQKALRDKYGVQWNYDRQGNIIVSPEMIKNLIGDGENEYP